jgi:long-chain acyl-CoA synthetase
LQLGTCTDGSFGYSARIAMVIMNPGDSLHGHSQRNPQKTALFCGDREMSFGTLDESTTALARWFVGQGLQPGDRVAVHWTNSIQAVQLVYALFKAGLTAVTINTRLKPAEIGYILNHSEAKICFSEPELTPWAKQANGKCRVFSSLPTLKTSDVDRAALPTEEPDRPAVLLYTSGTTARPKGVTHTHRTFTEVSAILEQRRVNLGVGDDERYLCVTPMMHAAALFGVTTEINLGRSVVLLPKFDPAAVLNAIEQFQCSRLTCMPTLWQFIVAEQERSPRNISSLSIAFAAGDAVPVALQERFRAVFGIALLEVYGLTESPVMMNPVNAIRPGSMGAPLEGVELRIVDAEGREVPASETGELLVRSRATCVGYWSDPDATRAALEGGWLHTGDLALRDADGYYWFRGRKKEIIIRAGSNISPQEVEEALYRHPAVGEVGVVGQPDSDYGEIVTAFVVLREGYHADPERLREFAKERLADYKVPERFVFLPDLPKGHRRSLKEMVPSASVG